MSGPINYNITIPHSQFNKPPIMEYLIFRIYQRYYRCYFNVF